MTHGTGYLDPDYGRQLYRLFRGADLTDIRVEMAPTFSTDYAHMRQTVLLGELERTFNPDYARHVSVDLSRMLLPPAEDSSSSHSS